MIKIQSTNRLKLLFSSHIIIIILLIRVALFSTNDAIISTDNATTWYTKNIISNKTTMLNINDSSSINAM